MLDVQGIAFGLQINYSRVGQSFDERTGIALPISRLAIARIPAARAVTRSYHSLPHTGGIGG